ncbi:MAG: hypothetical protein IJY04_01160 [Clostridia bacterium]|nr:hypothetical protein [Clostridia bacterium]
MENTPAPVNKGNNLKIFLILLISAIVLAVGVTVAVLLIGGGSSSTDDDYLPKDYGEDPSGLDEDHTARY